MKRIRLSTLVLLVIIVAMGMALVIQGRRTARREAELNAKLKRLESVEWWLEFHGMDAAVGIDSIKLLRNVWPSRR